MKILIVDDHEIVRSGIKRLVENNPKLNIVADLGSGEEAYKFLQKNTADLVIMDISMPGKGGIETTNQIKKRFPEIKVLMLSMHDNPMIIDKAMKAGANGYILKNDLSDDLLDAIEKVMNNEIIISASVDRSDFDDSKIKDLNNKEFEIFKSIASGEELLSIAKKLNIKYALMVNSGSSANLLAAFAACNPLRENRFKRGDHALIPALCWSTSLWPLVQSGLNPKFIDVDPKTLNLDADHIISKITKKTKVIMLINVLGISANNRKIINYAKKKKNYCTRR